MRNLDFQFWEFTFSDDSAKENSFDILIYSVDKANGSTLAPCDPYELIDADFISQETSPEKAREAFSDLENVGNVMELLQELEDTLSQAKSEGRSAADMMMHT